MVEGEHQVAHRMHGDAVRAIGELHHDGLLADTVGRQDGYLGLIDHGHGEEGAERSGIGDGKGAARDVVHGETLGPGPAGQGGNLPGDGPQPLAVGVVDDGDQQTFEVEVHGNTEVDEVVHDQLVVTDGRV